MPKKMTAEQFIAKAKAVHGEKYDYSKVNYINNSTKVTIIDPVYGEFQQTPANHLQGKGHPLGSNDKIKSALKSSKEEFIRKARLVHGDKYDYSKVEYTNNRTKVIIIDPIYGEFEQTPSNHLKGQGHPKEKGKKISDKVKVLDTAQIIERFKKAHTEGEYDYSKVEYHNMDTPVTIICRNLDKDGNEYGEYQQTPRVHLKGCGHPQEAIDKNAVNATISNEEYISRCKALFGDKYDYSECHYEGIHSTVTIRCLKHGPFQIDASNHCFGIKGCPRCGHSISKSEDEIYQYFSNIQGINVEKRNRTILEGKELDIYFPNHNLAIEYNGCLWHSEWYGGKTKNYHLDKLNKCNQKGIRLIHIFEDEYTAHKCIVLSKIEHILGVHKALPKIGARKCTISTITKTVSDNFLNTNHIQGEVNATVYYGAFAQNGDLVAVMTFVKRGETVYELNRFATDIRYIISGIAGKLLKTFIKEYKPTQIISFADRRWTVDLENNLYTRLGFMLDSCTKPDYKYFNHKDGHCKRLHKFGFRKKILHKKYGLPLTMTETEMVKELGYDRIWDCGLAKYVLNLTK